MSDNADDLVQLETKFYVETEKKKSDKQKRKEAAAKIGAAVARKLKREQKAKEKADADEEGEDERDIDAEEADYGETRSKKIIRGGGDDGEEEVIEVIDADEDIDEDEGDANEEVMGTPSPVKRGKKKGPRSPIVMEEGEEIEYVGHRERHAKFELPDFEELQIFGKSFLEDLGMPEFQTKRLQPVPYRRRVKSPKIVGTQPVKFKKTKLGLVPAPRRAGLTPPVVQMEGDEVLYEMIPEEEMEELREKYIEQYIAEYGGDRTLVQVPYMTPRRIIPNIHNLDDEELFKLCKQRASRKECVKIIGSITDKYGEDDDEAERDAEIRQALIAKIESTLGKAKIVERRTPGKYYQPSPPPKASKMRVRVPNPYNKRFPTRTRVVFKDRDGITRRGLVSTFAEPGITVIADRKEFKVKYDNPSLKVIRAKGTKSGPGGLMTFAGDASVATLKSILNSPMDSDNGGGDNGEIAKGIRKQIVEIYTEILNRLRGVVKDDGTLAAKAERSPKFNMIPLTDWSKFLESRFVAWRYEKFAGQIFESLDRAAIRKYAEEETARQRDFDVLLNIIIDNLGFQITDETTSSDIIKSLRSRDSLTPFESRFAEDLYRASLYKPRKQPAPGRKYPKESLMERNVSPAVYHPREPAGEYIRRRTRRYKEAAARKKTGAPRVKTPPRLRSPRQGFFPDVQEQQRDIRGDDLAEIMSECIRNYIRSVKDIEVQTLINKEVNNGLQTAFDQDVLRGLFEMDQPEDELKKEYDDYRKEYEKQHAKYMAEKANYDAGDVNVYDIDYEVRHFEESIYNNYGLGKNVYNYLRAALLPYLFLQGPLAMKANFFREKLANGMYKFNALVGANIAHYLPEFVMGADEHERHAEIDRLFGDNVLGPWEMLSESLTLLMYVNITTFIDAFVCVLDPTRRKEMTNLVERAWEIASPVVKLLVSPTATCQQQTGTGKRPKVDPKTGKYMYQIIGRGANKRRVRVLEDIPDGDLMICKGEDGFTCHSINEILIAIKKAGSKGKPINIQTGKPYPKTFIEKFKERNLGGDVTEPDDTGYDEALPKTPSPVRAPVRVITKKKTTKRHVAIRGAVHKEVVGIYLVGDEIEHMAGYMDEFTIPLSEDEIRTVAITNDLDSADYEPNVAIISFDSTQDPDLDVIEEQIKFIPKGMDIYILGVGKLEVAKNKAVFGLRLNKLAKQVKKTIKQIFYVQGDYHSNGEIEEEDVVNGFIDVVIDVEGITVGSPKKTKSPVKQKKKKSPTKKSTPPKKLKTKSRSPRKTSESTKKKR